MRFKLRFFTVLWMLLLMNIGWSQGKIMPLSELISRLEKDYNVTFSYDSELLRGVPVNVPLKSKNLKSALQFLDENTAFHFKATGKQNIVVIPTYPGKNFALCGTVFDQRTKEPLFGAQLSEKTHKYQCLSKDDGRFFTAINYSSSDSVTVTCSGYKRKTLPVAVFSSGNCTAIYLESAVTSLTEVFVTAYLTEGVSYDALDNSISLRPKNQSVLPGQSNGDILHSLDALPGISTPDSKAGNLNVRGSTSDQTLISFDQIPVYLKGHFFGTLSPFNAALIDRINVQRSVMSADKGGRVGGAIEITSPSGITNKLHGNATVSALDAAVYLQIPVLKDKVSIAVSGRKSYPYSVNTPTYKSVTNFIFQESEVRGLLDNKSKDQAVLKRLSYQYDEFNGKISAALSAKHQLTASFLYLQNQLILDRESVPANFKQGDNIRLLNTGFSATLQSGWSSKFTTSLVAAVSDYDQKCTTNRTDLPGGQSLKTANFQNTLADVRLQAEAIYKLSGEYQVKVGYNLHNHQVNYTNATTDTSNTSFRQDLSGNGTIHSAYLNFLGTPKGRFTFNTGLRINYFDLTKQTNIEPRVILSFKTNEAFRLKASGGYQKQFLTQVSGVSIESIGGVENQLWLLADNKYIREVSGYQFTAGGIYQKGPWLVDVEGYFKQVNNITSISLTVPLSVNPYIYGSMHTIGTDVLIRRQWKNLDVWTSYTLSKSMMQFDSINNGKAFTSLFDQTHVLDLACSYRMGQWKFSLAWKLRTGLAALPAIRGKMLHGSNSGGNVSNTPPAGPPHYAPGSATPYSDRFPMYHQLDASIYYGFPRKEHNWKGSVGLSAMNCYNQKNIIEQIPSSTPQGAVLHNVYQLGFMPNLFLSFSF